MESNPTISIRYTIEEHDYINKSSIKYEVYRLFHSINHQEEEVKRSKELLLPLQAEFNLKNGEEKRVQKPSRIYF